MNGIPLQQMIAIVEQYILVLKGVQVRIKPPADDRELQMLGLAYDVAVSKMGGFTYTYAFA